MKKDKLKKEYFVLGIIIVISLFLLLLKKTNQVNYELPEMNQLDTENISKIEITQPALKIDLEKKDKQWFIMPKGYLAEETKVKEILETVAQLTITEFISSSKEYSRYGLHNAKVINVKAYTGKELKREFFLGEASTTYQHTYIKLKDNPRVYHARKSFRRLFDVKLDDLRDKLVMKLDKNEIASISIKSKDFSTTITKEVIKPEEQKAEKKDDKTVKKDQAPPVPKVTWRLEDGTVTKDQEVDSLIDKFTNLNCSKYIEDEGKDGLKNPLYEITLKGNKDYTLAIFSQLKKDASEYPAISSENKYPFFLSSYTAEDIMKKRDDLVEKPKEEKKEPAKTKPEPKKTAAKKVDKKKTVTKKKKTGKKTDLSR